jgi:hypothetical protein
VTRMGFTLGSAASRRGRAVMRRHRWTRADSARLAA